MLRVALWCLTIVAAIPSPLRAASASFTDAPVEGTARAAAEMLGLDPLRDRERFLAELTRLLYTPPQGKSPALEMMMRAASQRRGAIEQLARLNSAGSPPPSLHIPVPLSAEIWSTILQRRIGGGELVNEILADRRAALLAHALSGMDDETLAFFGANPAVLERLYEQGAAALAAFGVSLTIANGRVVPPGGDAAVPLWEAAVGQPVSMPSRFVVTLYGEHGGRLAYLYDTIASAEAPARAFALGLWMADAQQRAVAFQTLAATAVSQYGEWRLADLPFTRPLNDLAMLLARVRVLPSGQPAPPASRGFWRAVFAGDALEAADDDVIDAGWLAATLGAGDMYERGDRLEQFAFGQRVFSEVAAGDRNAAVAAIRVFPRQRMLMLTLERLAVGNPHTYSAAAERARRVTGPPDQAFWTLAQLQGAMAVITTAARRGALATDAAERLFLSLIDLPVEDDRYAGAVATWVATQLLPLLPPGESVEARIVAALAGPPPVGNLPQVTWEGQQYHLDFAAAERRRLVIVRRKQGGYTVDMALQLQEAAAALGRSPLRSTELDRVRASLTALANALPPRYASDADVYARAVSPPRYAGDVIADVLAELGSGGSQDARRSARLSTTLRQSVDVMLGEALLSLAYAADIGDPDGAPMLTRNVALRHDFGFARGSQSLRERARWDVPRPYFQPGMPWHVTGSLLGLDLALAPQALRRISADRVTDAPRLASNQREAFAVSVVILDAARLRDSDLPAIANAVARGEARVRRMTDVAAVDEAAAELAIDGWRHRGLRMAVATASPGELVERFSLVELLTLGGGDPTAVDAWGMAALPWSGCVCSRIVAPDRWRLLMGRPQTGLMASAIPDINLHVALTLHQLKVPAALARPVLEAAVQDFIEEVSPRDVNDWWALVRAARQIPRERIEDYIASAAAVDGPLIPIAAADGANGALR